MKWYRTLYIGEQAEKKKEKTIRCIKTGAGLIDVYVLTEASNDIDVIDIVSTAWLKQPALRRNLPPIIGVAKGYDEALELIEKIMQDTIASTGGYDIRTYLKERK